MKVMTMEALLIQSLYVINRTFLLLMFVKPPMARRSTASFTRTAPNRTQWLAQQGLFTLDKPAFYGGQVHPAAALKPFTDTAETVEH